MRKGHVSVSPLTFPERPNPSRMTTHTRGRRHPSGDRTHTCEQAPNKAILEPTLPVQPPRSTPSQDRKKAKAEKASLGNGLNLFGSFPTHTWRRPGPSGDLGLTHGEGGTRREIVPTLENRHQSQRSWTPIPRSNHHVQPHRGQEEGETEKGQLVQRLKLVRVIYPPLVEELASLSAILGLDPQQHPLRSITTTKFNSIVEQEKGGSP